MTFRKKAKEAGISILAAGALAACFGLVAVKSFEFVVDKIGDYVHSDQIKKGTHNECHNKSCTP